MTKNLRKNELIIKPSNRVALSDSNEKWKVFSNFGLHKRRSTNRRRVSVCLCSNQRESCSDEGWENVVQKEWNVIQNGCRPDDTSKTKGLLHNNMQHHHPQKKKKRRRRRTNGTKRQSIHIMGCITSYKKYEALRAYSHISQKSQERTANRRVVRQEEELVKSMPVLCLFNYLNPKNSFAISFTLEWVCPNWFL